ncbi:MAG: ABC transporter ATP-binding protein [Cyclobacteriaceae bacterium]|nr:ABC transporter ATP-binding protein [Cyclobacteriaceae bacterium]
MNAILEVKKLSKVFKSGTNVLKVLDDITFSIKEGETMAIVGPSGSGKTTLLGLCAGLDVSTEGEILLTGLKLNALDEDDRAYVRNKHVGFVFQNFQLLPTLTALENVMIPLELRGEKDVSNRAKQLLERVGLGERTGHFPSQLSGGEQQRVAIARAFIASPKILFADEPTGNLDDDTATTITDLLFSINKEENTTLVLVTHNMELAEHTQRIVHIKGGKIESDKKLKKKV